MFRLFIFFPIILLSQDIYLLPDDADTLMHAYNTDIKNAKKEVFIFTAYLDDYSLISTLKSVSKKNIPVTLISRSPLEDENKISHLSLFKNISVFTLKSIDHEAIGGSFICIDDEKYYLINSKMDHHQLKVSHSFATVKEGKCSHLFTLLLQRSQAY